jgi:hypothetical protein
MLFVIKAQTTPREIPAVCESIRRKGLYAHVLPRAQRAGYQAKGQSVNA